VCEIQHQKATAFDHTELKYWQTLLKISFEARRNDILL